MAISDSKNEMSKDQFEEACVRHGMDMSLWPDALQASALNYVKTEEGSRHYSDQQALGAGLMKLSTDLAPVGDDAAFMARLSRIPIEHVQAGSGFVTWLKAVLLPVFDGFGPRMLVQQAAVFMVVIGLGVAAGVSGFGVTPADQEQVDISDGWFALALDVDASGDVLEE